MQKNIYALNETARQRVNRRTGQIETSAGKQTKT